MIMTPETIDFLGKWLMGIISAVIISLLVKQFMSKKIKCELENLREKIKSHESNDGKEKAWFEFVTSVVEKNGNLIIQRFDDRFTPIDRKIKILEKGQDSIERYSKQLNEKVKKIQIRLSKGIDKKEKRKSILLLEDNEATGDMLTLWLQEKLGLNVWRVDSAKAGIDKIPYVNLAVADMTLNGDTADIFIEYCIKNKQLYDNKDRLMILLYSGSKTVEKNKWGLPYISKPIFPVDVGEKVISMLNGCSNLNIL